ncbi:T9SS type A sorting domain-containing protein [candidate division KSB1 bacterium]|nr:T9SS type A sorting domain-containing protein [candidate division KSB1 bacterium]
MIGVGLARITGIASEQNHSLPHTYALSPNYPNPFNPRTTFQYQLAAPARVEIAIYNLLGQKIQVLLHEMRAPGFYEIQWDGQDQAGLPVASGIYFCVLRTPQCELKQKLVLLR